MFPFKHSCQRYYEIRTNSNLADSDNRRFLLYENSQSSMCSADKSRISAVCWMGAMLLYAFENQTMTIDKTGW